MSRSVPVYRIVWVPTRLQPASPNRQALPPHATDVRDVGFSDLELLRQQIQRVENELNACEAR